MKSLSAAYALNMFKKTDTSAQSAVISHTSSASKNGKKNQKKKHVPLVELKSN